MKVKRCVKGRRLCFAIFAICLSARFIEYFLIETDKTAIGENVLHKAVGIILLAVVLKRTNLTWSDIGFQRNGFAIGVLKGLSLTARKLVRLVFRLLKDGRNYIPPEG